MRVLADTSALVALVNPADRFNPWATGHWKGLTQPVHTCESVVSETLHLLRRVPGGGGIFLEMWHGGAVVVEFSCASHESALRALMAKYQAVPMSFADACLIRMCEMHADSVIWTLDADFKAYRRHGRQVVPVLMPEDLR